MSITDELREWANVNLIYFDSMKANLLAIADRIDAEHAEAQRRWMAELDAARDRDGWIELPKDADGKPIHVGDVMKGEKIGGGFCEPFEVVGYIMSNGELEPMDEHERPRNRKYLHHHKQPTVEDVLREMLDSWGELPSNATNEAIISEYAAKLRLAGEGDE